ncbi:MAG: energy transducer TonB [Roseateles depolymerans]|uniref:Energy transducer TonB n=1 Tax=Roseateles depolymerans TaxID=76731 RepID=A0A2W5DW30_9BURK|nr:MAG: energy transducer TonB [Roseateles depolymerans]
MYKRNIISLAVLAGLGVAAAGAQAQEQLERIEITGSAIKRLDAETAVPVTVFKMSELKQQGMTTVEQVLSTLTASQSTISTSQAVGASTGGASFANLRGVGANKTLVLLNGRRIANNAFDGSAPDLNMIPLAALDRVEVLRDGASSLYGTDAIGGVINFITRKDYKGATISAQYESPQHAGGTAKSANAGFGYGDLWKDGFNVFGFLDVQRQDAIGGTQRDFNTRYPGGLSGSTSPGNYYQGSGDVANPAAPSCAKGTFLTPAGDNLSCYMTTSSYVDYIPKSERNSVMLKGSMKLADDHVLSAEYFGTQSTVWTRVAPVPFGALIQNPFRPDGSANPYYPGNSGSGFTPTVPLDPTYTDKKVGTTLTAGGAAVQPGYVNVKWRDVPNGGRGDKNTNIQQRFVLAMDGTIANWDYGVGLSYNQNRVTEKLISGYANGNLITEGVLTGVINPFGDQDAAGQALLDKALAVGTLQYGQGTTKGLDAHASRELGDWLGAGRPAAVAFGTEFRRENFTTQANTSYASIVVASTGVDPELYNSGSRNVSAAYTELNVPLLKSLDVTAALRYDRYSDFGSTTNPKFSFRFQPFKQVLFRGAYSTGFRAPSLFEIHSAQAYTNTATVDDPLTCPNGTPTGPKVNNCNAQFQKLTGGNLNLKPEKSKTANLGVVIEPVADVSIGVDMWWLRLRNQIGAIADSTLFDPNNYALFSQYYHRDATGHLATDGSSCPGADCGYIDARTQNLGDLNTRGVDVTASYRLRTVYGAFNFGLNSTYVTKYEYQNYAGGPFNQNVGVYSGASPVFRWQQTLSAAWSKDQFSAGTTVYYKSGYLDADGEHRVKPYTTMDVYGSWRPIKPLSLTVGVHNLTDRDPPLSYQEDLFQAGYDPRFTNPTGRSYYVRGTYDF